jgi:hypothetical protein
LGGFDGVGEGGLSATGVAFATLLEKQTVVIPNVERDIAVRRRVLGACEWFLRRHVFIGVAAMAPKKTECISGDNDISRDPFLMGYIPLFVRDDRLARDDRNTRKEGLLGLFEVGVDFVGRPFAVAHG